MHPSTRIIQIALIGALLFSAFSVSSQEANEISYDYLDLNFITTEIESPNIDGEGTVLQGVKSLSPGWHIFGSYAWVNYGSGLEHNTVNFGIGFNRQIQAGVDVVARLGSMKTKFDEAGIDDRGLIAQLLFRGRPTEKFSMDIGVERTDFDAGPEYAFLWSGRYELMDKLAAGLNLRIDEVRTYGLDVRYEFR